MFYAGPGNMRNKRLDVLRCIAVLLVMLNHSEMWPRITHNFWIGVDLFFVLSGFLISGLLFSEYKKHNSIGFRRFFVRRGLKIYPAFYLFMLFTWAISGWVLHDRARAGRYLAEALFVQNYWQGVWDHTWSLGVEEHFYILLPILLLFLVRRSPGRRDPFRSLPLIFAGVAAGSLRFAPSQSVSARRTIIWRTLRRTIESTRSFAECCQAICITFGRRFSIARRGRRGIEWLSRYVRRR